MISLLPELNKAPWGEIDALGTRLLERMKSRLEGNRRKAAFLVDLSELNYMGSAMVALVVRLWKATKEKKARMAVVNSDENVLEVLRLSGLEQVWTITDTREAGLKALGISPKPAAPAGNDSATSAGGEKTVGPAAVSAAAALPSPVSRKKVVLWSAVTVILLVASGTGLYLTTINPRLLEDPRIGQALLFGGGVFGLIAATATATLGRGLPRTLGTVCVLGFLALLAAGVYAHPQRDLLWGGPQKPLPRQTAMNHPPTNETGKTQTEKTPAGTKKTGTKKEKTTPTEKRTPTKKTPVSAVPPGKPAKKPVPVPAGKKKAPGKKKKDAPSPQKTDTPQAKPIQSKPPVPKSKTGTPPKKAVSPSKTKTGKGSSSASPPKTKKGKTTPKTASKPKVKSGKNSVPARKPVSSPPPPPKPVNKAEKKNKPVNQADRKHPSSPPPLSRTAGGSGKRSNRLAAVPALRPSQKKRKQAKGQPLISGNGSR